MAGKSRGSSGRGRGMSPSSRTRSPARGYTLRGKNNKIKYVGITNDPARRASEHKQDGKTGALKPETRKMSRPAARKWEQNTLEAYRSTHGGKNPPKNRSMSGN